MALKCKLPSNTPITLYTLTANTMYILSITLSLTGSSPTYYPTVKLNVNGTTVYPLTAAPTGVSYSTYTVKTINIGGTRPSTMYQGSVYSVIIYTTNSSKLIMVEGYLAWKWFGSGSILPNTHAYYSIAPWDVGAQFNPKSVS